MNGFSSEGNGIYKDGMKLTSWPWSDLVSLLYSHCKDSIRSNGVVLELGCGAGPNIPFIQSLGMEYYGIDGSTEVVDILRDKFPNLKGKAVVGDFTDIECCIDLPSPDIIIDRAAVTHNNLSAIKHTLENSFNLLKSGGYFIGINWFSTKHSDYKIGREGADIYTRTDIEKGQFYNIGNVHFSNESHMRYLFSNFEIIHLSEKVINNYEPKNNHQFASWNIVAKKR